MRNPEAIAFVAIVFGVVAMFSCFTVMSWLEKRRREREAYYRSETLKRVAEMPGVSPAAVMECMREQEQAIASRRREGLRLGGVTLVAAGVGLLLLLKSLNAPFMTGSIPLLIGAAILLYAYVLEPRGSR
jgi:lipopolysaccharide export LptBFGC system permease protein LptF